MLSLSINNCQNVNGKKDDGKDNQKSENMPVAVLLCIHIALTMYKCMVCMLENIIRINEWMGERKGKSENVIDKFKVEACYKLSLVVEWATIRFSLVYMFPKRERSIKDKFDEMQKIIFIINIIDIIKWIFIYFSYFLFLVFPFGGNNQTFDRISFSFFK